jgi:nickel transport protein
MTTAHFLRSWLLAALLSAAAGSAGAHYAWLERDPQAPNTFVVRFGHWGASEPYAPERVVAVRAYDAAGRALPLTRSAGADGVRVTLAAAPALLSVHFDNGHWSRVEGGEWVNRPMTENPGAAEGSRSIDHGKKIVTWSENLTRPLGQPFEVVPLSAQPPRAGQPWQVRVLVDGRPATGVAVAINAYAADALQTDAAGVATLTPQPGLNRLWSGQRSPLVGDPRATRLSIDYLLLFEAR